MAQWLAEVSPKYAPPAAGKARRLPDTPVPAGVVRLPRYTLKDTKVLPTEEEVLSPKGEIALAMHRYITEFDRALNFFTLPLIGISKEDRALGMLREERRRRKLRDLQDLTDFVRRTDPAEAKKLKRAMDDTFMRPSNFRR